MEWRKVIRRVDFVIHFPPINIPLAQHHFLGTIIFSEGVIHRGVFRVRWAIKEPHPCPSRARRDCALRKRRNKTKTEFAVCVRNTCNLKTPVGL